jgi:radical SAM protein with 4Fe4S-binding SPASM domain
MLLRAKTFDLFQTRELTEQQRKNSELNLKEFQENVIELTSFPRRIVMELTNACNLRCLMCGRNEALFHKTVMTLENVQRFAPFLESIEEVTFCGWGEPTVNPRFPEILKYIAGSPVRKYLITNGTRLSELADALNQCQVDIIAVSIDGSRAETNNRIRVGSDFNRITGDLHTIIAKKREQGSKIPYLNFVFTAMQSNLNELPDLVRLAHHIGLDEVKVVYLTVFGKDLLHESLWNQQTQIKEVFSEAIELADQLGIHIKLPHIQGEDPTGKAYHKPCSAGWRDLFIGSDGYVRPCHSTALKLFPITKYNTPEEIWNSKEYRNFRAIVNDPAKMPKECRRCYHSSFANWNRKAAFIQTGQEFAPVWEHNLRKE